MTIQNAFVLIFLFSTKRMQKKMPTRKKARRANEYKKNPIADLLRVLS